MPDLFLLAGEVKPGNSASFCEGLTADLPKVLLTRFFAGLERPGSAGAAGAKGATSCFGGRSSLDDREEVGLMPKKGVCGFLGVPKRFS